MPGEKNWRKIGWVSDQFRISRLSRFITYISRKTGCHDQVGIDK